MELAAGSGGGGSGGHHHPLAADPDPDDLAAAINKHGEVVLQVGGGGRGGRGGRGERWMGNAGVVSGAGGRRREGWVGFGWVQMHPSATGGLTWGPVSLPQLLLVRGRLPAGMLGTPSHTCAHTCRTHVRCMHAHTHSALLQRLLTAPPPLPPSAQGVEALARVEAQLKGTAPAAAGGHHGHHGHHQHNHHNHNHNHHRADGADPGPGSNGGDPHGEGQGGGGLLGRRRRRHSAGLEDLHEPPARQLDALSIADPRRYFERSGQQGGGAAPAAHMGGGWGGAGGGGGGGPGLSGAAAVLGCVSPGCLPLPPLQGCAAEEALLEATPLARALAEEEAAGEAEGGGAGREEGGHSAGAAAGRPYGAPRVGPTTC